LIKVSESITLSDCQTLKDTINLKETPWIGIDHILFNLQVVPSGYSYTCHLFLDKEHRMIYVSNYVGGGLSAISLVGDNYALGDIVFEEYFPNAGSLVVPSRQEASHVHSALGYKGKFVYFAGTSLKK